MKKKEILTVFTIASMLGVSACGTKELTLTADHIEVELGSNPAAEAANYVADADIAADAAVDFSAVDVTKTGTYRAVVTYKDQTAEFEVAVVDTTAPEVTVAEEVVVAAGEPLYAKDVITGVTELSGKVEVAFQTPEETVPASEETEKTDDTETAVTTENADDAETLDTVDKTDNTEAMDATESTETERTEASAELSMSEAEFVLGDVLCSNAYVVYPETGEYDNTLIVTDASGNSAEVTVHITVGSAPEIRGVKNITAASGQTAETVDYLDGVTAVDSSGNDITADIVCDSSAVDLTAAGEYTVVYTVTDKDGFTATESAIVTVEEKSAKKPDEKKSGTSGKDSGDGNKNGNTSKTSGNGGNASDNGGNSGNTGASGNNTSGGITSGNNGNTGGSTSGNGGSNASNSGNNGSTSGNGGSTSGDTGNAGNTNGTSGGNTSSDSGNSGNTGNTGNAPADTGNTGNSGNTNTPSADNGGNTSTPSTDTGNTGTPDAGNTNTGSNGGEMSVPDSGFGTVEAPDWMLDNSQADPGNNGHGGGSADGTITFN